MHWGLKNDGEQEPPNLTEKEPAPAVLSLPGSYLAAIHNEEHEDFRLRLASP